MDRLKRIRYWLSSTIGAISLISSYLVRNNPNFYFGEIPLALIVIISVLIYTIGAVLGVELSKYFFSIRRIRSWFMGRDFVEGHWYLKTYAIGDDIKNKGEVNALLYDGILFIEYDSISEDFKITTTRVDEYGRAFVTISEIGHLRKDRQSIRYLNYFRLTYPGPGFVHGISHGEFTRIDGKGKRSDFFEAQVFVGGNAVHRQSATLISGRHIKKLRRRFGGDWIRHLLEVSGDMGKAL